MTKLQMADLHNLPVRAKLKVVQALWDDIANANTLESLPIDHKRILDERISLIDSGKAKFKPWSEVQKKYNQIL